MTGTYITFVNFERYKEMMKKILDEAKQELRKLAPTLSNILEDKQFKH